MKEDTTKYISTSIFQKVVNKKDNKHSLSHKESVLAESIYIILYYLDKKDLLDTLKKDWKVKEDYKLNCDDIKLLVKTGNTKEIKTYFKNIIKKDTIRKKLDSNAIAIGVNDKVKMFIKELDKINTKKYSISNRLER